ncbi:Abi family protein [Streptococcus sp. ZJ93]|uniref:Abi family protein n=1 Tax=Streptococcus handemini TaxID=3161188 RepID=UPI0032ECA7B1
MADTSNINLGNSNKVTQLHTTPQTKKGKSIDALMRHIRKKHNIAISGSNQKRKLRNIGYYHGYKAYKFVKKKNSPLNIQNFNDVKNIYDLDSTLKALLYPEMMKFETAISNYTLETIVENNHTDLNFIFKNRLNHFDDFPKNSKDYSTEMENHLKLKSRLESRISEMYKNSNILKHYLHKNKPVPIWAIFEHITLGDLGAIVTRLNNANREKLLNSLCVYDVSLDTKKEILARHVFILKELRNAIAHNSVVFDCRFRTIKIKKGPMTFVEKHTGLANIDFTTITDYIVLIVFYLKKLRFSKTELLAFVTSYEKTIKEYNQKINSSNMQLIFGTDALQKIIDLKKFIQ